MYNDPLQIANFESQVCLERILIPTDMSSNTKEALNYGIALARTYRAALYICHCIKESMSSRSINKIETIPQSFNKFSEQYFSSAGLDLGLNLFEWKQIISRGKVSDEILREAIELEADMIVISSRRRPYRAALFGSIAESICHQSPCPVLIIQSQDQEEKMMDCNVDEINSIEINRILVAYDFLLPSQRALSYALMLARQYGSEIYLFHVLSNNTVTPWYPLVSSVFQRTRRALQDVIPKQVEQWCDIEIVISSGQLSKEVLTFAQRNKIDLICIGRTDSVPSKWSRQTSNINWIIRKTYCPILISP